MQAKSPMDDASIIEDAKRVRERAHAVSFDFLMRELELALTFGHMALSDRYEHLAERRRADANKAYRTALRLVESLELNTEERAAFDDKEREFRQMLKELDSPAKAPRLRNYSCKPQTKLQWRINPKF